MSMPMQSFAQEISSYSVNPRFTYISYYRLYFNAENGNAHIEADLQGKSDVTYTYIKCNLEKLTGTYWMQMKSFSATGYDSTELYVDYPIEKGTYRVMTTFKCNTEVQTVYSQNDTY